MPKDLSDVAQLPLHQRLSIRIDFDIERIPPYFTSPRARGSSPPSRPLVTAQIPYVGQIVQKSELDIQVLLGKAGHYALCGMLADIGCHFGMDVNGWESPAVIT